MTKKIKMAFMILFLLSSQYVFASEKFEQILPAIVNACNYLPEMPRQAITDYEQNLMYNTSIDNVSTIKADLVAVILNNRCKRNALNAALNQSIPKIVLAACTSYFYDSSSVARWVIGEARHHCWDQMIGHLNRRDLNNAKEECTNSYIVNYTCLQEHVAQLDR